MATRRPSRTRARDSAEEDGSNSVQPTRPTKRVRAVIEPPVETPTDSKLPRAAEVGVSEWRFQSLPAERRASWDEFMAKHFHLYQPHELYDTIELARHLKPDRPQDAFVATIGVRLTGPFDLLSCKDLSVHASMPLYLHGRFFHDPAEVVTIAEDSDSSTGSHWAIHRDSPKQPPAFVVEASDAAVCSYQVVYPSLFDLLRERLVERSKKARDGIDLQNQLTLVNAFIKHRGSAAVSGARAKEQTAASLSGLGIRVPCDAKKRQGYRELPITGENLRELLQQVEAGEASTKKKLSGLITRATIANDECDFGTSLLLGLDLLTRGTALQKEALQLLRVAYMLLNRKEFAKVTGDHVKHRVESIEPLNCLAPSSTDAIQLP